MFYSLIPLDLSLIAQVTMLGSVPIAIVAVGIVSLINFVLTLLSLYVVVRVSGNRHFVSTKVLAAISLVMVVGGSVYSLLASNFLSIGPSSAVTNPPFSAFFAPHVYNALTQVGGTVLLNIGILFFSFRNLALKKAWLIILIVACINAPWFMVIETKNEDSYRGANLLEVSPNQRAEFNQNIVFSNQSVELASLPEVDQTYKTLLTSFVVSVAESGYYLLDMKIFRLQAVDEVMDEMTLRNTPGDAHGTYYLNDVKTDWYESPNRVYFEQGANTVTVAIPFVYTNKFSGELAYNLHPVSSDQALFGPYELFFQLVEYETERGSIDLGTMQTQGSFQYFVRPSFSVTTQQYQQEEIFLR